MQKKSKNDAKLLMRFSCGFPQLVFIVLPIVGHCPLTGTMQNVPVIEFSDSTACRTVHCCRRCRVWNRSGVPPREGEVVTMRTIFALASWQSLDLGAGHFRMVRCTERNHAAPKSRIDIKREIAHRSYLLFASGTGIVESSLSMASSIVRFIWATTPGTFR